MSLGAYARILGRGPGRPRSLTREEAAEAMRLILSGGADRGAIGALLMLMRYRGETGAEVAGTAAAALLTAGAAPTPAGAGVRALDPWHARNRRLAA